MLKNILAGFYERDIRKLIEEVKLFKDEANLWRTTGSVKNSSGNLVLHLIGGTNYLIGTTLAHTGYVRNREQEFIKKGVARAELLTQLEQLIPIINRALADVNMDAEYPLVFDDAKRSNSYLLVQLLAHLNYHMGQVNYLRRILEPSD
jgi:hypothetical protein